MTLALRALPFLAVSLLMPILAHAQEASTSDDMRAAVMAQLLQDPRSADISPEQLQQLVDALAQKAQDQQVTPEDIMWQPALYTGAPATSEAAPLASYCDGGFVGLCTMSEAFGFVGDNPVIPLYFLVTSALLMFLIIGMKRHHHAMGHFDTPQGMNTPAPGQGMSR